MKIPELFKIKTKGDWITLIIVIIFALIFNSLAIRDFIIIPLFVIKNVQPWMLKTIIQVILELVIGIYLIFLVIKGIKLLIMKRKQL
jgi:hypothetical protein